MADAVSRDVLEPNDGVIWLKEQRGGYGFLTRVFARVERLGFKRVLITCLDKRNGEHRRWVSPGRLRYATPEDIEVWPIELPVEDYSRNIVSVLGGRGAPSE